MGQTVDQVEARITQTRQRLAADLHALEAKVDAATDWRGHVARRPYMWLGAAFVAGFILAGPNGRGTGRVARVLRAETGVEGFDKFIGALGVMAVDRAKTYLDQQLPGFSQAFERGPRA